MPSFGDDEAESRMRFNGTSDVIKTQAVDDAPVQARLGIEARNGAWTVGGSYELGADSDDRQNNRFWLRAAYAF